MTTSLFAAKRYTDLLNNALPDDAARNDLYGAMLKRERQLDTALNRAAEIDRRVQSITEALPDASAKARTELLAERRDLLAERDGLPLDVSVSARLYALAVADFTEAVHGAIAHELGDVRHELDLTAKDFHAAKYDVEQTAPDDERFEAKYTRLRDIVAKRKPFTDRADDLRELGELTTEYARTVLSEGASATGHARVKIVNNRPIDKHIDGFVLAARRKVAA